MGNRGMTNWKLGAFFVMSLMLFAAVFSNTVMAAKDDGAGTVAVATFATPATGAGSDGTDGAVDEVATVADVADGEEPGALPAGSKFNALQFTYTAWTDANDDDDADPGEGINMAGGRVRIAFPTGWAVSNKFVQVTDGTGNVIYQTNGDGKLVDPDEIATLLADDSEAATMANAAVSLSDANITINLGTKWGGGRDDAGRDLVIIFSDVQASTTAGPATFTSSSSARGGNLVRLKAGSPEVTVGNILGVNITEAEDEGTPGDPLDRKVEIEPAKVYPGEEDHRFTITFTAPGPMSSDDENENVLVITIPTVLQPANYDSNDDVNASGGPRVLGRGGAVIGDPTINGDDLTVPLTTIAEGQTVVVTYTIDEILEADATVVTGDPPLTSAFGVSTRVDTRTAPVTTITGGLIGAVEGSGRMQISPASVENGATKRDFTLTYTAYTAVTGNIQITPAGIVLDDADDTDNVDVKLQNETSGAYGFVGGSTSPSGNSPGILDEDMLASGVIEWEGVTLAKGAKLTIDVDNVDVTEDADNYGWEVRVGTPVNGVLGEDTILTDDAATEDVDETAVLTVVDTEPGSVTFDVVGDGMYPAASKRSIEFRFTAESTPIRDGSVWFKVPATLGSVPAKSDAEDTAGTVDVTIDGGTLKGAEKTDQITVSGASRIITANIESLEVGGSVTITYGIGDAKSATVVAAKAGDVKVIGKYKTSTTTRTAETATVTITNVEDGAAGAVTISAGSNYSVEAGSNHGVVSVKFTALGTMDDGRVSLELPRSGWGTFQRDPAKRNYIQVSGNSNVSLEEPAVGESSSKAVAKITKLAAGRSFTFVYGGGSAGLANGAEVQDNIGIATFVIESDSGSEVDGKPDGVFAKVFTEEEQTDTEKIVNPDKLGAVFMGANGDLKVEVEAAADGTGVVVADPKIVRAAADGVKIAFTYTSTQTIQDGELRFTVPSGWDRPQVSDEGAAGYTVVGGSGLGTADAPDGRRYVTVPIASITKGDQITITYGEDGSTVAPTATGPDPFTFAVRGTPATDGGTLKSLSSGSPSVTVERQASGKAMSAMTTVSDGQGALHAGQDDRQITVVYTAAGEMVAGQVRLTVPAKAVTIDGLGWSAPTADNVTVTPSTGGSIGTVAYGGSLSPSVQTVIVDGVNLNAGGTITFVYTGKVQPLAKTGVAFAVATHGGLAADAFADVEGPASEPESVMLTVDVEEAKTGSGMAEIADSDIVVAPDATGETITFTYTAVGEISYPREFRVRVPAVWSTPSPAATSPENAGTYSVEHTRDGLSLGNRIVEEIAPVDRDMVARVRSGILHVMAGDQIIITYENATAPPTVGVTPFGVYFGGQTNDAQVESINVFVQSAMPSQLMLSSAGTVSADPGAAPLAVTVSLQDAAGMAAGRASSTAVTLTSSAGGRLSKTVDGVGTAILSVDIPAGETSSTAYYSNSTAGTATITASAPGSVLTADTQMITVSTGVIAITADSVTVSPALAKAGDMVTISARGTPGQTAMFSVGLIVTTRVMDEAPAGSYSGMFAVVPDQHADGLHGVTVNLGTASAMGSLTIDSTAPAVTVTAPESAGNGDTVMISATVTEAGTVSSVMADVSALDSTQTAMVALAMAADGSYSASVTISDDNAAVNGAKTVTVTAMDAAGNSGMGTASVMLDNKLSFTSTIPAGTSLFHVPLDVEGLDTVGDLKTMLGDAVSLAIVYDDATSSWNSRSDAVAITADLGIILSMTAEASVPFEGDAWGGGISMITLGAGLNLIGLPINDPRVVNVSSIITLAAGAASSIVVSTDDGFASVSAAGDAGDGPVRGDAAYLVTAISAATIPLLGSGWTNDTAGAAPIALTGYNVDGQTAVLDVQGAIVDEITGLAREGFRVKVKNLSTKASLSKVTSVETAEGYNMTFVDLKAGHAARIGDVLEISADSPNPLIGVQPVRHIVTVDDVKNSTIQLEELIAYEIPAETELLRNYPNPFNPETWIPYHLSEDADVKLTIYDVNGELVRDIDVGHQTAAKYDTRAKAIYWDGRNRFGEQVASGIYFYHLDAGDFSGTRKMVILK